MITHQTSGNMIGIGSLICSLAFWAFVAIGQLMGHFPAGFDMPFKGWLLVWAMGVLLAIIAAVLGSRWWAVAVILPIASCIVAIHVVRSVPF